MQSIETFSTTHLIGDRLQLEHLDQFCIMHQDPQVMATLGGVRSHERSKIIQILSFENAYLRFHWSTIYKNSRS